jgi:ATP-dependent exoDNAse (exonuclease V) alpha subunit
MPQETELMKYKDITLKDNKTFHCAGEYLQYEDEYSGYKEIIDPTKQITLYGGAGGTGKTYINANSKTFVKRCFFSPSWKLATDISSKYNVPAITWARLAETTRGNTNEDGGSIKDVISRYNVWVIDEVSMMDNKFKDYIIKIAKENYKKVIFMGDVGFQLPAFTKGAIQFNNDNIEKVITLTKTHRFKEPIIINYLQHLRMMIKNRMCCRNQIKWLKDQANIKIQKYGDIKPRAEDLIITSSQAKIKEFNCRYKGGILENYPGYMFPVRKLKWCVKRNSPKYKNTQIVIGKKPNTECVEQYAYTIHSIQGETIDTPNKLYIDCRGLWAKEHLYTALSRARKIEQVILIIN